MLCSFADFCQTFNNPLLSWLFIKLSTTRYMDLSVSMMSSSTGSSPIRITQRLRRINQMAMAHLVYQGCSFPPASFTRRLSFDAAGPAGTDLQGSGDHRRRTTGIQDRHLTARYRPRPFSHALEQVLAEGMHHEELSLLLIKEMNRQFGGKLQMALEIFTDAYPKNSCTNW